MLMNFQRMFREKMKVGFLGLLFFFRVEGYYIVKTQWRNSLCIGSPFQVDSEWAPYQPCIPTFCSDSMVVTCADSPPPPPGNNYVTLSIYPGNNDCSGEPSNVSIHCFIELLTLSLGDSLYCRSMSCWYRTKYIFFPNLRWTWIREIIQLPL